MPKTCKDCKHCIKRDGENCCNVFGQIITNKGYCTDYFESRSAPKPVEPVKDMVNHPDHYTRGKVECIDAIEAGTEGLTGIAAYCTGQVIKYIWRWPWKGKKLEDLKKCRWYLDKLIEHVESGKKDGE